MPSYWRTSASAKYKKNVSKQDQLRQAPLFLSERPRSWKTFVLKKPSKKDFDLVPVAT